MSGRNSESALETVVEGNLLQHCYVSVRPSGVDREHPMFPETVLDFIRQTQPAEWAKLEALHGATERTILPLKERRSALIAVTVTGRIDVEACV